MGCETSTEIGAIADADVVYVLRMQRERMESAFVPSLREYAARWGVTPERVRPGQKVMHPGPINRGVEIDGRVADSPDSLILEQVRAGLAVRMAVLHDAPGRAAGAGGGRMTLFCRNGRSDSLVLEGRLAGGECVAVTVTDGVISAIEPAAATSRVLAPAFVDPHVHLRSPGREDEETIASGTAAAAAGGYCAILAMPNTDPVVDSAAVLGSLVETARREALVPTGFMAAISKRLGGEELTEMGELADAGAAAFTDDGRPVTSAGLMRRALQYGAVTGRTLALHCEEPTLSRDGQVHEGAGLRRARLRALPLARRERDGRARPLARRPRGRPLHLMHLSAKESVEALRRAHARGIEATAEVTPHHLVLTDEAVRSLDPNVKMNPPLRADEDRRALIDALRDGTIACVATDHAPHSREEKEAPFEEAPFGVTGLETSFAALYTHLVEPGSSRSRRCSSACPAARPARSGCRSRGSRSARARTSSCSTSRRSGRSRRAASAPARRTRGCSARRCAARS